MPPVARERLRGETACRPKTIATFDVMIRLIQKDEGALQELLRPPRWGGLRARAPDRQRHAARRGGPPGHVPPGDPRRSLLPDEHSRRAPWLLRIARNAAIDIVRRRRRDKGAADPKVLDLVADTRANEALDGVVLGEFSAAVRNALAELPMDRARRSTSLTSPA